MHTKQQLDNYLMLTKIPLGLYPEAASIMHVLNSLSGLGVRMLHFATVMSLACAIWTMAN
jgi:hypothetical protein